MRSFLQVLALCAAVSLCLCYGTDLSQAGFYSVRKIQFNLRVDSLFIDNLIPCFPLQNLTKAQSRWKVIQRCLFLWEKPALTSLKHSRPLFYLKLIFFLFFCQLIPDVFVPPNRANAFIRYQAPQRALTQRPPRGNSFSYYTLAR